MFNSIQKRLTLSFSIIILLTLGFSGGFLILSQRNNALEDLTRQMLKESDLIGDVAAISMTGTGKDLDVLVKKMGMQIDTRITIVDNNGKVLADSFGTAAVMENTASRPEISSALQGGIGSDVRYSAIQRYEEKYVATPIYKDGVVIGASRVGLPLSKVEEIINQQIYVLAGYIFLVCAILILVSWVISRSITRPIRRLINASQSIAAGNYGNQITGCGRDEVGQLTDIYNDMSRKLKEKQDELQQHVREVEQLSLHDGLTGLYNRRGFFEVAQQQLKLAERSDGKTLLLYIDLNDFKTINDMFGHEAGDNALVQTALFLSQQVRKSDILARLGGDEFVILLINISDDSSTIIIERLLANLREFNLKGQWGYEIKMSIGISFYNPEVHHNVDELIASSDKVMYGKKKLIKESESFRRHDIKKDD